VRSEQEHSPVRVRAGRRPAVVAAQGPGRPADEI